MCYLYLRHNIISICRLDQFKQPLLPLVSKTTTLPKNIGPNGELKICYVLNVISASVFSVKFRRCAEVRRIVFKKTAAAAAAASSLLYLSSILIRELEILHADRTLFPL